MGSETLPLNSPGGGRIVSKSQIAWNIGWNWAGTGVQVVAAFIVAPFLIRSLGDSTYGLWILMVSITEFLGLFDLGVRSSVARQLAYSRSQGDQAGVNGVLNSSLAITCCVGIVVFAGTAVIVSLPPTAGDLVQQISGSRSALLLLGINFAVYSISNVFDGSLSAFQRFDALNAVDIATNILRAALMYISVLHGHGLQTLAVITLITNVVAALAKGLLCFRFEPNLEIRAGWVQWNTVRGLYGYGAWNFLTMVGAKVRFASAPVMIGAWLGVGLVTPYSIAVRLVSYATLVLQAVSGVVTPVATALDARQMDSRLQRLILEGGKFSVLLTLFFATWLIVLSRFFIGLWIGPRLADTAAFVVILALGEILPMSQLVSQSALMGMAKHRIIAYWSLGEAIVGTILAAILMTHYGLAGLCIALAIAATVCRGAMILINTCRAARIDLLRYVKHAFLPPFLVSLPPALGLWLLVRCSPPDTWSHLVLYSVLLLIGFGASSVPLIGHRTILAARSQLLDKARSAL